MDPKRHPDPRHIKSARDLNDHQTAAEVANSLDASERDYFVFGAGRRLCQGMHLGKWLLILATSQLLWRFGVRQVVGFDDNDISTDAGALTKGMVVLPQVFQRISCQDL
ncbi:hypothetical protein C7974DRAFT_404013 [Boeremia exigua]|uniref:uncharacterized protein n=1 Tax=Boeremia exigua TaxID=749465 RepID=UPI001E8DA2D7|nr:uncharacterized protein C7974DRAFT_404013 [Boeremia exigua]KAH6613899.1 hypothetical protein C7974DRAFT_404013 [Boeremia exigua]